MIESVLIITMCAIVGFNFQYDCSTTWTVEIYDPHPPMCYACVTLYDNKTYLAKDASYFTWLQEMAHLKCQCNYHENKNDTNTLDAVWNIMFGHDYR